MASQLEMGIYYGSRVAWCDTPGVGADRGSPAFVLLHGSPGTCMDWEYVVGALGGAARTIAVDRPGYGLAGPASPSAASIRGNARIVGALIEETCPGGAVVVGHSHAGGIAIALAASRPSFVRGLVLVASIGSPKAILPSDFATAAPLLGGALSYLFLGVVGSIAPGLLARMAMTSEQRASRADVKRALDRSLSHPRVWKTYVWEQRTMIEETEYLSSLLPEITAPTLVVAGDADPMVPSAASSDLADQIPGARLTTFAKTSHSIPYERPRRLARALLEFQSGLTGKQAIGAPSA